MVCAALAMAVVGGLGGCVTGSSDADIRTIKIQQFRALVDESRAKPDKILLVDTRTAEEFGAVRIDGSRNIPPERLRPESPLLPELDRYETIIVYGADPASGSARSACKRLMDSIGSKVLWFQGGMKFWRASALPVIEANVAPEPKPVDISPKTGAPPLTQPQPTPPPPGGIPR